MHNHLAYERGRGRERERERTCVCVCVCTYLSDALCVCVLVGVNVCLLACVLPCLRILHIGLFVCEGVEVFYVRVCLAVGLTVCLFGCLPVRRSFCYVHVVLVQYITKPASSYDAANFNRVSLCLYFQLLTGNLTTLGP